MPSDTLALTLSLTSDTLIILKCSNTSNTNSVECRGS